MLPPLSLRRSAIAVSKSSQPFPFIESVAGMVDAWLWLDELFTFKAASKDIALHMKEKHHRPLWEDENDNWAGSIFQRRPFLAWP